MDVCSIIRNEALVEFICRTLLCRSDKDSKRGRKLSYLIPRLFPSEIKLLLSTLNYHHSLYRIDTTKFGI